MDAPTLQAQLFPHISRSICLFKSVQSPKKPQGIEGGCSEFTGVFDKYSHQESLSSSIWDLGFGIWDWRITPPEQSRNHDRNDGDIK
ncbi:MAG: hypothetical protein U7126_26625 [Microcoleus sp.]